LSTGNSRLVPVKSAKRFLAGFVPLALSIAIPASFSAEWFIYALWIAIGLAVALLIILSDPLQRQIPWKIERKNPELDKAIGQMVQEYMLRKDLQTAFARLGDMKKPTAAELRAFADNVAERLKNEGHAVKAKRMEVHLPDNASPADVAARKSKLWDEFAAALIWDNYS
jgi:hypothetical protein